MSFVCHSVVVKPTGKGPKTPPKYFTAEGLLFFFFSGVFQRLFTFDQGGAQARLCPSSSWPGLERRKTQGVGAETHNHDVAETRVNEVDAETH